MWPRSRSSRPPHQHACARRASAAWPAWSRHGDVSDRFPCAKLCSTDFSRELLLFHGGEAFGFSLSWYVIIDHGRFPFSAMEMVRSGRKDDNGRPRDEITSLGGLVTSSRQDNETRHRWCVFGFQTKVYACWRSDEIKQVETMSFVHYLVCFTKRGSYCAAQRRSSVSAAGRVGVLRHAVFVACCFVAFAASASLWSECRAQGCGQAEQAASSEAWCGVGESCPGVGVTYEQAIAELTLDELETQSAKRWPYVWCSARLERTASRRTATG